MRVLMLSKACIVGIYQRKLELMAAQGIDLLVLVPPSWKDERGEQELERVYTEGYRLETVPIALNGNFHLHFYRGLGKRIHEFCPDIVHIDEEPYNLATWQALYHARQNEAKSLFFSWQNINRSYPFPFNRGEQWVLKHIDYALMGTDSAGRVWREKGYAGRMATIPQFGTDPELFAPCDDRPERPFTIGYIGRLVEEKGVDLLLNALAKLPDDCDWNLRIIGAGPARLSLESQAESLGIKERITILDWMPSTELPAQYHHLDALVLPSRTRPNWKEQFGRVLIEAMASGVPVIGSDSGAIPGVIRDAGLIVPEDDVLALTETLHRLMKDAELPAQLRERGRKRVLETFTHQRIAEATVAVYREMLSSS